MDDGGALSLEGSILEDQPFEIFSAVKAQDRERFTDVPTTACGSGEVLCVIGILRQTVSMDDDVRMTCAVEF